MTRPFAVASLLIPLLACAAPCQPRITQAEAIRIAKRQLARDLGAKAVAYFGPYTAELRDCVWRIRGATPPQDVSGDVFISVNARTTKAHVEARLRTDPRKLGKLSEK